jgi:hypothetical protein
MADYCLNHPHHIEVRNWGIVVAGAILGALATIVVAARMWLRGRIQRNLDASDWFMFAGLVSLLDSLPTLTLIKHSS